MIAATVLGRDAQTSFWDAIVVRSAAELGCAVLWSEDFDADQEISCVRIRNPFTPLPPAQP